MRIALIGLGGQGPALLTCFRQIDDVDVAYVCDPDKEVFKNNLDFVGKVWHGAPRREESTARSAVPQRKTEFSDKA